jgi:hypothetical protein
MLLEPRTLESSASRIFASAISEDMLVDEGMSRASFSKRRTEKAHLAVVGSHQYVVDGDPIGDYLPQTKSIPYRSVARYNDGFEMIMERCLCALAFARWMRFRCGSVMMLPGVSSDRVIWSETTHATFSMPIPCSPLHSIVISAQSRWIRRLIRRLALSSSFSTFESVHILSFTSFMLGSRFSAHQRDSANHCFKLVSRRSSQFCVHT